MICLPAIPRQLTPANTHGTVLSILFARAISIAPADQGCITIESFGAAGVVAFVDSRREGVRSGEEKERR